MMIRACIHKANNIISYLIDKYPNFDIHMKKNKIFKTACYHENSSIYKLLLHYGCNFSQIPLYELYLCDDYVATQVMILYDYDDDLNYDDINNAFFNMIKNGNTKMIIKFNDYYNIDDITIKEGIEIAKINYERYKSNIKKYIIYKHIYDLLQTF